jgi:hypothetical protein
MVSFIIMVLMGFFISRNPKQIQAKNLAFLYILLQCFPVNHRGTYICKKKSNWFWFIHTQDQNFPKLFVDFFATLAMASFSTSSIGFTSISALVSDMKQ